MIESISLQEEIINILSKKYDIEKSDDEEFAMSDENHLCLKINTPYFLISELRKEVEHLGVRVIRYGSIVGISLI